MAMREREEKEGNQEREVLGDLMTNLNWPRGQFWFILFFFFPKIVTLKFLKSHYGPNSKSRFLILPLEFIFLTPNFLKFQNDPNISIFFQI